jgi:hypothetical protein
MNDLVFTKEQDTWVMRLQGLWDDEELLFRYQQRVQAPSRHKELTGVIIIHAFSIRRGELNLGAGGPKELRSHGLRTSMGRDALYADKHLVGEGPAGRRGKP